MKLFVLSIYLNLSLVCFAIDLTPIKGYVDAKKVLPEHANYYVRNAASKGQTVYAIWYDNESSKNPMLGIKSQVVVQAPRSYSETPTMSVSEWEKGKMSIMQMLKQQANLSGKKFKTEDAQVDFGVRESAEFVEGDSYVCMVSKQQMQCAVDGVTVNVATDVVIGFVYVDSKMYTVNIMHRSGQDMPISVSKDLFLNVVEHLTKTSVRGIIRNTKSTVGEVKTSTNAFYTLLNTSALDLRYASVGEEKAKGLEFQIDLPKSMERGKSFQPHTVVSYKTVNQGTDCSVQIHVSVFQMPSAMELLLREIGESDDLDTNNLKELVTTENEIVSCGKYKKAGAPVVWMQIDGKGESYGKLIFLQQISFLIPSTEGQMLNIVFSVSSENHNVTVDAVKILKPMMTKVMNSLTFLRPSQFDKTLNLKTGNGTAWFVAPDVLVTCWHVVSSAKEISYNTAGGSKIVCKLLARDEDNDLALLRSDVTSSNFLTLGDEVSLAERVFTLGYPTPDLMGQSIKFTDGTVSATRGMFDRDCEFQVSCPMQPGNSGGPVFSDDGRVVGVASSRLESKVLETAMGREVQNVNFAIKCNRVKTLLSKAGVKVENRGEINSLSREHLVKNLEPAVVLISVK